MKQIDDLITPDILKDLKEGGEYKPENPEKTYLDYLNITTTFFKTGAAIGLSALIVKMNGGFDKMQNFFKDERGVSCLEKRDPVQIKIEDILKQKYRVGVTDEELNRDYSKPEIKYYDTKIKPLTEKEGKRKLSPEEVEKIQYILANIINDNNPNRKLTKHDLDNLEQILNFLLRKDGKKVENSDICPDLEILNPNISECVDELKKTGVENISQKVGDDK